MEIEANLAEKEIITATVSFAVPKVWLQLATQEKKTLAKQWGRLIRQMQQGEEAADVED